jgi:aldehyde dehydrogenase (NAD+)
MHSETGTQNVRKQYHPMGMLGLFRAQFPVAVWVWNTALAWLLGDVCVWKPSEKTLLCGIARREHG